MATNNAPTGSDRRGFFRQGLACGVAGLAALAPAAVGLRVIFDPLRRQSATAASVKVTSLAALPADGIPRKFPVLADRVDAWNKFTNVPIGAVYLRRTKDDQVKALHVACPHAGCFVDFSPERGESMCPCHNSSFSIEGRIATPGSPSPRDLDPLTVEVRPDGGVWVVFQDFQAGRPDRVPVT